MVLMLNNIVDRPELLAAVLIASLVLLATLIMFVVSIVRKKIDRSPARKSEEAYAVFVPTPEPEYPRMDSPLAIPRPFSPYHN